MPCRRFLAHLVFVPLRCSSAANTGFLSSVRTYVRRKVQQEERERQRQEQLRIAREQYLQKMDQEAQRKKQAQDVMLKLENEERELINRLRKTQELQEKVGTYHVQVFPVVA
jgi:Na+-translocating ferredoxin:NAD+ oxidoreductase RnfG subunit